MSQTQLPLGFRMPGEWHPHSAVWLAWPHDPEYFGDITRVEEAYLSIIEALSGSEPVDLLVLDDEMKTHVSSLLRKKALSPEDIRFHIMDYADVWIRDYGPIFILKDAKELAMTDWIFNGYGKFPELLKDDRVPEKINRELKLPAFKPGIVLEGGAIETNGEGLFLTTEQCVLNPNRNPGLSKEETEKYLKDFLGANKIIWLKEGLVNDHTDGHVDNIARFIDAQTIVCNFENNPHKPNYKLLSENWKILESENDTHGKPLKLIKLPLPEQLHESTGETMAVSYANFYIGNKTVLVPVFGHENDEAALAILESAFPEKKVVGIDSRRLIYGGGTIHCITQQQPRAT